MMSSYRNVGDNFHGNNKFVNDSISSSNNNNNNNNNSIRMSRSRRKIQKYRKKRDQLEDELVMKTKSLSSTTSTQPPASSLNNYNFKNTNNPNNDKSKQRSYSICCDLDQLHITGIVLGTVRMWEERSRSFDASQGRSRGGLSKMATGRRSGGKNYSYDNYGNYKNYSDKEDVNYALKKAEKERVVDRMDGGNLAYRRNNSANDITLVARRYNKNKNNNNININNNFKKKYYYSSTNDDECEDDDDEDRLSSISTSSNYFRGSKMQYLNKINNKYNNNNNNYYYYYNNMKYKTNDYSSKLHSDNDRNGKAEKLSTHEMLFNRNNAKDVNRAKPLSYLNNNMINNLYNNNNNDDTAPSNAGNFKTAGSPMTSTPFTTISSSLASSFFKNTQTGPIGGVRSSSDWLQQSKSKFNQYRSRNPSKSINSSNEALKNNINSNNDVNKNTDFNNHEVVYNVDNLIDVCLDDILLDNLKIKSKPNRSSPSKSPEFSKENNKNPSVNSLIENHANNTNNINNGFSNVVSSVNDSNNVNDATISSSAYGVISCAAINAREDNSFYKNINFNNIKSNNNFHNVNDNVDNVDDNNVTDNNVNDENIYAKDTSTELKNTQASSIYHDRSKRNSRVDVATSSSSSSSPPTSSTLLKEMKVENEILNKRIVDLELERNKLKTEVLENSNNTKLKNLENLELLQKIDCVKNDLMKSEKLIAKLRAESDEYLKNIGDKNEVIAKLQMKIRESSNVFNDKYYNDLKFERDSLLLKVDGMQKVLNGQESELDSGKKLNTKCEAENSWLKSELDRKSETILNLHDDVLHLRNELNKVTTALNEKDTKICLLSADLNKFETDFNKLSKESESQLLNSKKLFEQNKFLEKDVSMKNGELAKLQGDLSALKSENDELNARLEFNLEDRGYIAEELEAVKQENAKLKQQLEEQQSLNAQMKSTAANTTNNYNNETASSESKERCSELEQELLEAKQYCSTLINQIETFQSTISELNSDYKKLKMQLQCEIGGLTDQVKSLEKEKAQMHEKLRKVSEENVQLVGSAKQDEQIILSRDKLIRDYEKQIADFKKSLGEKKPETIIKDTSSTLANKNNDIEKQHANSALNSNNNNNSNNSVAQLQSTIQNLKRQIRNLEIGLEEAKTSNSELNKKIQFEVKKSNRLLLEKREMRLKMEGYDNNNYNINNSEESDGDESVYVKVEPLGGVKNEKLTESYVTVDNSSLKNKDDEIEELKHKISQLEEQLLNAQTNHEQELSEQRANHRRELSSRIDEMMKRLTDVEVMNLPVDEDVVRKKYMKDVNRIKEMYDRGFNTLEKSQQQTIADLKRKQIVELEKMRQEKELLLKEEAAATQAG
ncbi:hypothetical protein HELRODRAFT_175183 [Helobdella robusta]|uniref:Uncharacterized protein n=1 Tax=Helobdella robusta TaxID=6412 RepID=T1F8Z1_HELRO|nr:hypothetical protein HELRODRAFT_175183 [Helobdella robusta]ESO01153.1 hypothetical protein HELRODRAFT_175183 [Helobdella robusta]